MPLPIRNYTRKPQLVLPTAAAGVTVAAGGGSSWSNSAWVEITAGLSDVIIITGLIVDWNALDVFYEIDIGLGGAGSEVVRATICAVFGNGAFNRGEASVHRLVFPQRVAANTRIAVRCRNYIATTTNGTIKMRYHVAEDLPPLRQKMRRTVYAH